MKAYNVANSGKPVLSSHISAIIAPSTLSSYDDENVGVR